MKKVIIIHGWDFSPKMNWYPWLKKELEKKGVKVIVPGMPNTSEPKIAVWISHLKKTIKEPDENTYFVGHSIGCQTIMRYLGGLPKNIKIAGMIFVAGWFNLKNLEDEEVEKIAEPWLTKPIDFPKVRIRTNKKIVFLSANDPYNYTKENQKKFKKNLKAKVIIEKNKGHFKQGKFPRLLKEMSKMMK